jgi:CheY-like chemotaxis protein
MGLDAPRVMFPASLERAKLLSLHNQMLAELVCAIGSRNAIKSRLGERHGYSHPRMFGNHPFCVASVRRNILVVEDDAFVRKAACELLRESGFEVLESENAVSARAMFRFSKAAFDAVFCDVILPDANGIGLCREFQTVAPAVRIIVPSGYPIHTQLFQKTKAGYFLRKPYSADQLIAMLQQSFANEFQAGEFLSPKPIPDCLENVSG